FAETSAKKIALSNNYAGNSWRQAMLTSWGKVTGEAVKAGTVPAAMFDHYLGISRLLAGQIDFRSAIRSVAAEVAHIIPHDHL
ncbi:hypothetical protein ACC735_39205, partial [Rhizobium ruizarguesonis]